MKICIIRNCGKALPTITRERLADWNHSGVRSWQRYQFTPPGPQSEARLCDEHYAPVSEAAIRAYIDRILEKPK